jgi:quercetin dioxygenase-like cupin family protein
MGGEPVSHSFIANLPEELFVPEKGILSRVLCKDEHVIITMFGFSAGEELSAHSAPTPAILYFLEGEAEVQLGEEKFAAGCGSFAYMPPLLPHAIAAKSPLKMLLIQVKRPSGA